MLSETSFNIMVPNDVLSTLKFINLIEEPNEGYYSINDPILKQAIRMR